MVSENYCGSGELFVNFVSRKDAKSAKNRKGMRVCFFAHLAPLRETRLNPFAAFAAPTIALQSTATAMEVATYG